MCGLLSTIEHFNECFMDAEQAYTHAHIFGQYPLNKSRQVAGPFNCMLVERRREGTETG